jgi:hypothetical protein
MRLVPKKTRLKKRTKDKERRATPEADQNIIENRRVRTRQHLMQANPADRQ